MTDADHNVYQAYVTDDLDGTAHTHVAVFGPDGEPQISAEMPGNPQFGPQLGSDGTVYLITDDGQQTYVSTVAPDATTVTFGPAPGRPADAVPYIAGDGTIYLTTYTWANGAFTATSLTSYGSGGTTHTTTEANRAPYYGGVAVAPDGTVYQVTTDNTGAHTYVTTIGADGVVDQSVTLAGRPAEQALVMAPDGTAYLTTTLYDAGADVSSTYLTALATDGSYRTSAPLPGYPTAGVVIGPDGTLTQTTESGTSVVDPSGWTPHRAPVADDDGFTVTGIDDSDGTVTGVMTAHDPDGQQLTYTLEPGGDGSVVVHPDGTWTFTPTTEARNTAYDGTGPDHVTFTVVATDGEFHTPIRVTAPIDPAARRVSVELPAGATVGSPAVAGADGTVYQVSHDDTNRTTYVTVVGTDGVPHTTDPLPGVPESDPITTADGTAYLTTVVAGSTYDDSPEYLHRIDSHGNVTTVLLPERAELAAVHDGRAYLESSRVATAGGLETYVTVVDPDGVLHTTDAIPGSGGAVVFAPDGTAYVVTRGAMPGEGTQATYVTSVTPDGDIVVSDPIPGYGNDPLVITPDGSVYQVTSTSADTPAGEKTYAYAVAPDGSTTPVTLDGKPSYDGAAVAGPGGTMYVTTYTGERGTGQTTVSAIGPGGTAVSSDPLPGTPVGQAVVGASGTVYLTTYTGTSDSDYETHVNVVDSEGHVRTADLPGHPSPQGFLRGSDGTLYQISYGDNGAVTYVTVMSSDGTVIATTPVDGAAAPGALVGGPGGAYVTTARLDTSGAGEFTRVWSIRPDGSVSATGVHNGLPLGPVEVGTTGTIYQSMLDFNSEYVAGPGSFVVIIGPDGAMRTSNPISGFEYDPRLFTAGPDGTLIDTTRFIDPETGTNWTYVTVVGPDGSIRTSGPLAGIPLGGVAVGPDGTGYQTTDQGLWIVDVSPPAASTV